MSAAKVTVAAPGNGADHLKSRVGLDLDSQAKASALIRLYDSMADETARTGLDDEGILSMRSFYHDDSGGEGTRGDSSSSPLHHPSLSSLRTKETSRAGGPRAKKYSEFTPPLAPGAIRLLLFFLDGGEGDGDDRGAGHLRAAADAAVAAAVAELEKIDGDGDGEEEEEEKGAFASSFHVTPGRHMTVFQASHPASIVPDSTSVSDDDDGEEEEDRRKKGDDERQVEEEAGENNDDNNNDNDNKDSQALLFGAPPPGALEREIAAARAAALAAGSPPRLVGHRVFLARSGALLLVLTEQEEEEEGEQGEEGGRRSGSSGGGGGNATTSSASTSVGGGRVAALRREAAARMPRASKRQPAIMHVTLGRLLSPLPSADAARRVSVAAERAARPFLAEAKSRKEPWVPRALAHVVEDTFASVDGDSVLLPFRC